MRLRTGRSGNGRDGRIGQRDGGARKLEQIPRDVVRVGRSGQYIGVRCINLTKEMQWGTFPFSIFKGAEVVG